MSDRLRVEPAALVEASRSIGDAADGVDRLVQGLTSTVSAGNPWGGDDAGTLFGAAYGAVLGQALDAFASHVEQLGQARDSLQTWALSVLETDDSGAAAYGSVRSALGGD